MTGDLVPLYIETKAVECITKVKTNPNYEYRGYPTVKRSQFLDNMWLLPKETHNRGTGDQGGVS